MKQAHREDTGELLARIKELEVMNYALSQGIVYEQQKRIAALEAALREALEILKRDLRGREPFAEARKELIALVNATLSSPAQAPTVTLWKCCCDLLHEADQKHCSKCGDKAPGDAA